MVANNIVDVITNPSAGSESRRLARELVSELLGRPFSAAEAAEKLGVSKPTAIKWLRAGLVQRADGTANDDNLFDAASVLTAREILRQFKGVGSVVERARLFAGLPEQLYWQSNPKALSNLRQSLEEAERGRGHVVSEDELAVGRSLLAKRQARRRAHRAHRRQTTA